MPISRSLSSRIENDAKAPDYWYIPKGQAVSVDNWDRIAEHLRVLADFEEVPWPEAQPHFAQALREKNLIDPYKKHEGGFSAVARMQFPVWRLLGLAWLNTSNEPEITDVGREFISRSRKARRELLAMQLHRQQFFNPCFPRHFANFRTFPVLALYRLLSQTGWRVSWQEFILFGTRIRDSRDADVLADLVEEWRGLTAAEQRQLLSVAQTLTASSNTKSPEGTTWGKIQRDLNYLQAVLRILPALRVASEGLSIPFSARKSIGRLVLGAADSAEFVDYSSEQDWLAIYGQVPTPDRWKMPWTTAAEARIYYERIGRIDAAADAYRKEDVRASRGKIERYRSIQVLEKVLEDILEHHLDHLEQGLKLVKRQYPTAVGPIDLLAEDAQGLYVVIELKRGRSGDRVVGQIARYITWVIQRLARGRRAQVRGIIVGRDFDKKFEAAVAQLNRVTAYTSDIRVSFEVWPNRSQG